MLLVAFDVQAVGALTSVTRSEGLLAVGLVLASEANERTRAVFDLALVPQARTAAPPLRSAAARTLLGNAMADVLPFVEALALDSPAALELPLSRTLALRLEPVPVPQP